MTAAVLANGTGFVEQRIVTAVSALETLSWTQEVVEGGMTEAKWRQKSARRVRWLLAPMRCNATYSELRGRDALTRYGRRLGYHDIAETVAEVRNAITHPKPTHDLYTDDGLLLQTWRHVTMWLELAVLHRLRYTGHFVDRTVPGGWVGVSAPVPWAEP